MEYSNLDNSENLKSFLLNSNSIKFSSYKMCKFSIIVLTYNCAGWTLECLKSLEKANLTNCEIIIIDNNSTDHTRELLKKVEGAKIVLNAENIFYSGGCNQGADLALGEYLVFLNDDIIVNESFIQELYYVFENYPDVGIAGAKLIQADGKLQEAGNIIWNDGTPISYGRYDLPNDYKYNFIRKVDYCSAAMIMIKKNLFTGLGGFDTHYHPAYFEDTDLAMKIAEQGYHTYYTPFAFGYHKERGSSRLKDVVKLMSLNQRKFFLRWKDVLQKNHFAKKTNMLEGRIKGQRTKILYVDHRVPVRQMGGGYPRAYEFLNTLNKTESQVTIFPLKKNEVSTKDWTQTTEELQRNCIEVVSGDIEFDDFCRERICSFDLIIVSRFAALKKVFLTLKSLQPNTPIIFDSEALDFPRQQLKADYLNRETPDNFEMQKNDELDHLEMVDFVFFVSQHDRNLALAERKDLLSKSAVLSHACAPDPTPNNFKERKDVLFIGSFIGNTGLNEHAIKYYINDCWSQIYKHISAELLIAGYSIPDEIKKYSEKAQSINIIGFVEDLKSLYNKTRIVVIPHQFAGGIPFKLTESLAFGVPCLVSDLVAKQVGLSNEQGVLICKTEQDFIVNTLRLYQDESLWMKLREQGMEFIEKNYSVQNWNLTLKDTVTKFKS